MFGASRLTRLMILLPFTSCISDNWALVRFEVRLRRWLLPPLVRTTLPEPVRRKRLDVALCVFNLVLPVFALRGILLTPFRGNLEIKKPRDTSCLPPADVQHLWDLLYDWI